jgi:hypothetical protein
MPGQAWRLTARSIDQGAYSRTNLCAEYLDLRIGKMELHGMICKLKFKVSRPTFQFPIGSLLVELVPRTKEGPPGETLAGR